MSLVALGLWCAGNDLERVMELVKHADIRNTLSDLVDAKSVNIYCCRQLTVLHAACLTSTSVIVDVLLKHGARSNVRDSSGNIAIHYACNSNIDAVEKVQALINTDKKYTHVRGEYGYQPLHLASVTGDPEVALLLLGHGADIEAVDEGGGTPLHVAAYCNNPACVTALLSWKADINRRDDEGHTPLHTAVGRGSYEAVNTLTAHSLCDITIKNQEGLTALDIVRTEIQAIYERQKRTDFDDKQLVEYNKIIAHLESVTLATLVQGDESLAVEVTSVRKPLIISGIIALVAIVVYILL